jgi:DNA repair protein RecO (recombination protein O)
LQIGNSVEITWQARLEEQLGTFRVEPLVSRAHYFHDRARALYGLGTIIAWLRFLPERDTHPRLFETANQALEILAQNGSENRQAPLAVLHFELSLLNETGFGLSLDHCAVTGQSHDLAYVSPKTGRAVSRAAGAAYAERLLPYPALLRDAALHYNDFDEQILSVFRLTGFFLEKHLISFPDKGMPQLRDLYLNTFKR